VALIDARIHPNAFSSDAGAYSAEDFVSSEADSASGSAPQAAGATPTASMTASSLAPSNARMRAAPRMDLRHCRREFGRAVERLNNADE